MTALNTTSDISSEPPVGEGIPGLAQWYAAQDFSARHSLRALADLLNNIPARADDKDAFDSFLEQVLGVPALDLVSEAHHLSGPSRVAAGLAIAELVTEYSPEIGPHSFRPEPPRWETLTAGDDTYHFPTDLAFFCTTVIPGLEAVVRLSSSFKPGVGITVYVRPADQALGRALMQKIITRAEQLGIFRGRVLHATTGMHGLEFEITNRPTASRTKVIATNDIWDEVDLNVRAVSTHGDMMNDLGLGVRRGVLLAGPPGVGKSAITSVIAAELAGPFTVVYCDSRSGSSLLRDVFDECVRLGPSLIVIEDVDLIVGRRHRSGFSTHSLSEFLAALDSHPSAPLLVMATTNDVTTLDSAAVRAARFDAIVEVPYPTPKLAQQILQALLQGVPGAEHIDAHTIAASLPRNTSGADIREIVRRAVLMTQPVTTQALQSQISSGRYRPTMPDNGNYL